MAWTTPQTWTAALVTVAEMNTHVRDNLMWLKSPTSDVATLAAQITTTSTSFTDATGLSVTMTTNGGNVLCIFSGTVSNGAAIVMVDIALDGTRRGATDGLILVNPNSLAMNASFVHVITGVSAASHTFKIQWKTSTGTATMYAENSTSTLKCLPSFYCVEMG